MNVEILGDKMNPLLKRREINFRINHKEATPSREAVKNHLAALLNSQPELVVIEKLSTVFGKQGTLGYAGIYQDPERVGQIAQKHLLKRGIPKPKEEKKEVIVEVPKPEAKPKEDKKEVTTEAHKPEAKPKEEKKEVTAEAKPTKSEIKPKGEAKPKEEKKETTEAHKPEAKGEVKPKEEKKKEEKKEVTAEAKPAKTEAKSKGEGKPGKEEKTKEKTKKE